ncbi:uncharacterized protein LOC126841613 [Adelges cooleyi]|uniref:uncharacterized protein LOC126833149 n=1 Tax=Adelges cooleyi TaxID=133065 RepID=UPI00217FAF28|nr:uncharacterized protein LOC126833149 [Adelges cooleyi]XP_050434154.1 uncharacterized protein LOC126841613 [Adelges cooleyi]
MSDFKSFEGHLAEAKPALSGKRGRSDDGGPDYSLPPPFKMHKPEDPHASCTAIIAELREQIAKMQQTSKQKDAQIFMKDKLIFVLKAKRFAAETELRKKMDSEKKVHNRKAEMLTNKVQTLQNEVDALTKSNPKLSGKCGGKAK